jgi:hypothetical protein
MSATMDGTEWIRLNGMVPCLAEKRREMRWKAIAYAHTSLNAENDMQKGSSKIDF